MASIIFRGELNNSIRMRNQDSAAKVTGIGPVKSGKDYGKHLDKEAAKRTAAAKALAAEKAKRRKQLAAAFSDGSKIAGNLADQNKGKTHTPTGSDIRKSGASHNAEFVKVWNDGDNYNINVPIA